MKKILSALGAMAAVLVITPMFAAFEAHVVNVTATIENALSVPMKAIEFGTVFPQEKLEKPLDIALSGSFMDPEQTRVDTVEYFIRQKPKCGWTSPDGVTLYHGDHTLTETGHLQIDSNGVLVPDCGRKDDTDRPNGVPQGAVWGLLPNLCPYLSKHEVGNEDEGLNSFHWTWKIDNTDPNAPKIVYNDVFGKLVKGVKDRTTWMIDLAVPCFTDHCAQDWETFVESVNPGANPDEFIADPADEHKVYGCDLWVEVSGVKAQS